jgi:hypothetical protein
VRSRGDVSEDARLDLSFPPTLPILTSVAVTKGRDWIKPWIAGLFATGRQTRTRFLSRSPRFSRSKAHLPFWVDRPETGSGDARDSIFEPSVENDQTVVFRFGRFFFPEVGHFWEISQRRLFAHPKRRFFLTTTTTTTIFSAGGFGKNNSRTGVYEVQRRTPRGRVTRTVAGLNMAYDE